MWQLVSIATTFAIAIFCAQSAAFDIAFTEDDAAEDGYDYNPAFLSRIMGETCHRIPLHIDSQVGPSEVLVRAKLGDTPVPNFIALYDNSSPQLKRCNSQSLISILAFDPAIFDRQQMNKVWTTNVWYWKDIDYDEKHPDRNEESNLISKFSLKDGEALVQDPVGLNWRRKESPLELFEWDKNPFLGDTTHNQDIDRVENRPTKEKRIGAWMRDIGSPTQLAEIEGRYKYEDVPSIPTDPEDRELNLSSDMENQIDKDEQRLILVLPDTPPGVGHGLEISGLVDASPPQGQVGSVSPDRFENSGTDVQGHYEHSFND